MKKFYWKQTLCSTTTTKKHHLILIYIQNRNFIEEEKESVWEIGTF